MKHPDCSAAVQRVENIMTNLVHQDKFYRDTTLVQTVPTWTAKTRAMLRLLRPLTDENPMTVYYSPASMRSATLTYFIAVPLGVIALVIKLL